MQITWSHGRHFHPHNRLEDTLCALYQDSLRVKINKGEVFVYLNDNKRPHARGNLITSIPCTTGPYNAEAGKFEKGNQADGLKIYKGRLPSDQFPVISRTGGRNPKDTRNSLENRKAQFRKLLTTARAWKFNIEHWDVHFSLKPLSPIPELDILT